VRRTARLDNGVSARATCSSGRRRRRRHFRACGEAVVTALSVVLADGDFFETLTRDRAARSWSIQQLKLRCENKPIIVSSLKCLIVSSKCSAAWRLKSAETSFPVAVMSRGMRR
jgi:hypothetical protein